jgi:hypothetical protein
VKLVTKHFEAPKATSDSLKNLLAPAFNLSSSFNNSNNNSNSNSNNNNNNNNSYRSQTVPPNQWSSVEVQRDQTSASRKSE